MKGKGIENWSELERIFRSKLQCVQFFMLGSQILKILIMCLRVSHVLQMEEFSANAVLVPLKMFR